MSDFDLEKAREAQRVTNAYHRVFAGLDGKIILEDLNKSFGFDFPAFMPRSGGEFDPIHAAIRDGQRQVILHINSQLSAEAIGDGNVEKPQATVETE